MYRDFTAYVGSLSGGRAPVVPPREDGRRARVAEAEELGAFLLARLRETGSSPVSFASQFSVPSAWQAPADPAGGLLQALPAGAHFLEADLVAALAAVRAWHARLVADVPDARVVRGRLEQRARDVARLESRLARAHEAARLEAVAAQQLAREAAAIEVRVRRVAAAWEAEVNETLLKDRQVRVVLLTGVGASATGCE